MADKFRTVFPIPVTLFAGEIPDYRKFNGISKQAKSGLGMLEAAIGDIWNQSGDAFLDTLSTSSALMIPNLARVLGRNVSLSARLPSISSSIEEYTFGCGAVAGKYKARLPFAPSGTTWSWGGGASHPVIANRVTNRGDLVNLTQWYIDTASGDIETYAPLDASWTFTYKPQANGDFSGYNIIPDLSTTGSYISSGFGGIKICYTNGVDILAGYDIWLPPRLPCSVLYSNGPDRTVSSNFSSSPDSGTRKFWQDPAQPAPINATFAAHYRYNLPVSITTSWGSWVDDLPAGMIYLWDYSGSKTIIEGVVFRPSLGHETYKLWASGNALDQYISDNPTIYTPAMLLATGDHSAAQYPSNGLKLVVVAVSATTAIRTLASNFSSHNHHEDGPASAGAISHSYLTGLEIPGTIAGVPQLTPSHYAGDDHPQYLERHGFNAGRDHFNNSLLGDLHLASTVSGVNAYNNLSGDSNKIVFGDATNGPFLRFNHSTSYLDIEVPLIAGTGGVEMVGAGIGGADLQIELGSGVPGIYLSKGNIVLTDGSYKVSTKTKEISTVCSFVPRNQIGCTSAWIQTVDGHWTTDDPSHTDMNNPLTAYISNFPEGMTLLGLRLYYYSSALNTLRINATRIDLSETPITVGTSFIGGTLVPFVGDFPHPLQSSALCLYPVSPALSPGTWTREKHSIKLSLTKVDAGTVEILPIIGIYCSYQSVSPWLT